MSFARRICLTIWLVVLAGATSAGLAATVTLDNEGNSFAISPNGALCVASTVKGLVSLYPSVSSKGITDGRIDQAVGKEPVSVIFKEYGGKQYFIVACRGNNSIVILDAQTLKEVKTVQVAQAPTSLGSALKENPWVFYGSLEGLGCIDLKTFKDEPSLYVSGAGQGAFQDLCLSADGHLVYGAAKTWTPSGRLLCSIDYDESAAPAVKMLGYIHETISHMHADPFGSLVAYDRRWDRDMNRTPDSYAAADDIAGPVSCFMTTRPLILSLDQDVLKFYSYNTHKELASTSLAENAAGNGAPNPFPNPNPRNIRRSPNPYQPTTDTVLVDEKNGIVLICSTTTVKLIELASLNLPNEPLLGVTLEGSTVLNPGVAGALTLKKLNANSSVELKEPREGMKLTNDTFSWTPGGSDVGDVKVQFNVTSGEFHRVQSFSLAVRRPEIDLPFVPDESVVTDDGNFALLLGHAGENPRARRRAGLPGQPQQDAGSQLLLVDLTKKSIVVQRDLPKSVHAIAIDAQHAYAAATDSDAVYVYSLKDLTDERKVFAPAPVSRLISAGGKLYVATQQGQTAVYSPPDLKPLDDKSKDQARNPYVNYGQPMMPVHTDEGWEYEGLLYDADLTHVLQLKNPAGFTEVNPAPFNPNFNNGQLALSQGWGLAVQNDRLIRMPGQTLGTIQGSNSEFLRDLPAVATLLVETVADQTRGGELPHVTTSVLFFDLVSATRQSAIVLSDETQQQNRQYGGYPGRNPGYNIITTPGRIDVLAQDKLYVIQTNALDRAKFPEPPRVSCEAGIKIFDHAKPTVVAFTAEHLKSPVEFSLDPDVKGLDIDKTGKLTVDGPELTSTVVEQLAQGARQQMNYFQLGVGAPGQRTPAQAVEAMSQAAVARYTAITGKHPEGIPVLVHLNVVAVDTDQQKARCEITGFLCVPTRLVVDKIAAEQSQQAANLQRQQQMYQNAQNPRGRAASQPSDSATQRELEELKAQNAALQKQVTELTAQNKMLKEMVLDQKKSQQ